MNSSMLIENIVSFMIASAACYVAYNAGIVFSIKDQDGKAKRVALIGVIKALILVLIAIAIPQIRI